MTLSNPFKAALLSFALALGLCPRAFGQVNIEAQRIASEKQGLSGQLEAALTGRAGNTEGYVAGGAGRIQAFYEPHLVFLYGTADYSRLNQQTQVSRFLSHIRYNYHLEPRLWAEAFAQIENDRFRKLTTRQVQGLGPRVLVVDHEDIKLYAGSAYMLELESLAVPNGSPDEPKTRAHRWSNYLSFKVKLDDRLGITSTTYIQPRLDQFSDYRVLSEGSFSVQVVGRLSTKVTGSLRYDSEPPWQVKPLDVEVKNSLVLTL